MLNFSIHTPILPRSLEAFALHPGFFIVSELVLALEQSFCVLGSGGSKGHFWGVFVAYEGSVFGVGFGAEDLPPILACLCEWVWDWMCIWICVCLCMCMYLICVCLCIICFYVLCCDGGFHDVGVNVSGQGRSNAWSQIRKEEWHVASSYRFYISIDNTINNWRNQTKWLLYCCCWWWCVMCFLVGCQWSSYRTYCGVCLALVCQVGNWNDDGRNKTQTQWTESQTKPKTNNQQIQDTTNNKAHSHATTLKRARFKAIDLTITVQTKLCILISLYKKNLQI